MAGKKKKSLANKLARMSDEERARYLQHKAEMEEEARRRKEQLISTFMKKKIKKEETFSRLNLAKINQNWHQIMRKIKVKEMKEEVDYLKNLIERVLEDKNKRIDNLMNELEEAEEQYSNNFNSHSIHLDIIIENQNDYVNKLQSQYQEELDDLLDQAQKEKNTISQSAESEARYLKTVIYGQEFKAVRELKDSWEEYNNLLPPRTFTELISFQNNSALRTLRKTRQETEMALWTQILKVVRLYVQRTDVRRSHLQELRRIDAESAEEIRNNEERIIRKEDTFKTLTIHYEDLIKQKSDKINSLETEETFLKTKFLKVKNRLKLDLELDEKQLRYLTAISNEVLNHLVQLSESGRHLLSLSRTCQKYETERERVMKWVSVVVVERGDTKNEVGGEVVMTDDEKLLQRALEIENSADELLSKPFLEQTKSPKLAAIKEIKVQTKRSQDHSNAATKGIRRNFLDACYEDLEKMENFWMVYNKAEVDIVELKQEKATLENENKHLKGMIRAILEAAALAKTVPNSTVSTMVIPKKRASTAPLHKIML
ncbi:dynein regulatory complex subunit 2 [Euwallacea similis]|uniref:dynein regulatory complex subunit 2 n=1 Tax=Euwallacea similis TaxID=1736056 RepID=UPI00344FC96E